MAELTKEWLQKTITEIEDVLNANPNKGNDIDVVNMLAALKIAQSSLRAEAVLYMNRFTGRTFTLDEQPGADKELNIYVPLYAAPPVPVVPDEMYWQDAPVEGSTRAAAYATGWNACRVAMLQDDNALVSPTRLPGGFTIEDAKELHEDLVRSHISQALSGEKMKKKDRDADLRWIHGVIVQAAWFVKASLEQNEVSCPPAADVQDNWISCSARMPEKGQNVLISVNFDSSLVEPLICSARYTGSTFRRGEATIKPGNGIEQATHWMPLPKAPQQEVKQ